MTKFSKHIWAIEFYVICITSERLIYNIGRSRVFAPINIKIFWKSGPNLLVNIKFVVETLICRMKSLRLSVDINERYIHINILIFVMMAMICAAGSLAVMRSILHLQFSTQSHLWSNQTGAANLRLPYEIHLRKVQMQTSKNDPNNKGKDTGSNNSSNMSYFRKKTQIYDTWKIFILKQLLLWCDG